MIAIRGWQSSIKIRALFGLILAIKFTSIATLIVYRGKYYREVAVGRGSMGENSR
jgi:hypothetical protein